MKDALRGRCRGSEERGRARLRSTDRACREGSGSGAEADARHGPGEQDCWRQAGAGKSGRIASRSEERLFTRRVPPHARLQPTLRCQRTDLQGITRGGSCARSLAQSGGGALRAAAVAIETMWLLAAAAFFCSPCTSRYPRQLPRPSLLMPLGPRLEAGGGETWGRAGLFLCRSRRSAWVCGTSCSHGRRSAPSCWLLGLAAFASMALP